MSNPTAPAEAAASRLTPAQQNAVTNFANVGKLSDFVKDLGKFDGKPTDLISWITDIEGIFDLYKDLPKDTVEYGILLRTIRRKIIGEAADVLNANNVLYDWEQIKSTLLLYYRDQRDVNTLDFELSTIKKQPNESISSYFSRVNELLSNIIVQAQVNEDMHANASAFIDYFRKKALDSFVRGLEKPLNVLLKTANVGTLSKAYQFCMEYHNMDLRSAPFRNEHSSHPIPKPREISLPPRPLPRKPVHYPTPAPRQFPPPPPPRNFNPFHRPQFNQIQTPPKPLYQPFGHQNPFQNQKFPKPEPMEIDHSIQSRNVNYGNRPNFQMKRQYQPSNQAPNFKRLAHPVEYAPVEDTEYAYECDNNDIEDYTQYGQHGQYDQHEHYEQNEQEKIQAPEFRNNPPSTAPECLPSTSDETNFLEWNPSW